MSHLTYSASCTPILRKRIHDILDLRVCIQRCEERQSLANNSSQASPGPCLCTKALFHRPKLKNEITHVNTIRRQEVSENANLLVASKEDDT